MNSWKTTSTGILAIVGALVTLWFERHRLTPEIVMAAATAVLTGIGLILARDNDKTSEDAGAKPAPGPRPGIPLMLLALCGLLAFAPGCASMSPLDKTPVVQTVPAQTNAAGTFLPEHQVTNDIYSVNPAVMAAISTGRQVSQTLPQPFGLIGDLGGWALAIGLGAWVRVKNKQARLLPAVIAGVEQANNPEVKTVISRVATAMGVEKDLRAAVQAQTTL